MGHRGHMQQVELLDDALAPVGPAARTPHGVARRWLWPLLGTLVVGLVATQTVLVLRDRTEQQRVRALPGVVQGVTADVAELWRVDEPDLEFLDRSVTVAGAVVGVQTAADGSQRVVARDGSTGRGRWSAPLRGPDPLLAVRGGRATTSACQTVPLTSTADSTLVACLGSDAVVSIADGGRTVLVRGPERSHVVVVDTADGHVVSDQPAPAALALATLPGLVVLGMPGADGHAELTAQDLVTGDPVWHHIGPAPDVSPAGDVSGFRVFRLGDRVGVEEAGRQVTLLSASGEVARPRTPLLDGSPVVVGKSRLELLSGFATGEVRTTIVRPGQPDTVVPGHLIPRSVDDGSLADVELTYGSILQAWDARTGGLRWQADGPVGGPVVVLRGIVYCTSGAHPGGVIAFDGRIGAELWSATAGSYDQVQTLLTDGSALIVANTPGADASTGTFDAFALGTGAPLWHAAMPDRYSAASVHGKLLVAASDASAAILGSPAGADAPRGS